MLNHYLNTIISPPRFPDNPEKTGQARLLHIYLLCHTVILLVAIPIAVILATNAILAVGMLIVLICVNFLVSALSHQGYVSPATIFYIIYNWINSAVFLLISGGASPVALFFPIIAMAALFWGLRAGIVSIIIILGYLLFVTVLSDFLIDALLVFELNALSRWFVNLLGALVLLIPIALKYDEVKRALHLAEAQLAERNAMEQGLRESEERFRVISSVISDYTFSSAIDEHGTIENVLLTGAFEEITGYSPEEFVSIGGWAATIYPDDQEKDARDFEMLRNNQAIEREIRVIHKSGDVRWVKIVATPVWDDETNKLMTINGGVSDITARKRAETIQQTLYNISKARTNTDNLEDLIRYTHEQLKQLIKVDNFYVALYDEETQVYSFPYVVDLEDDDWSHTTLENSLTDYVRRTGESLLITADEQDDKAEVLGLKIVGEWSPVWIGAPLKTAKGIFGVIAVQDYASADAYTQADLDLLTYISENIAWVIESKHQEEELKAYTQNLEVLINERTNALRSSNEQLELILNNTSDALAFAEPNGDIIVSNPAFATIFGSDNRQALEHILKSLKNEDQATIFSNALLDAMNENSNQRVEAQVSTPEDQLKDIDIAVLPVMEDSQLMIQGILLSGRDITHVREVDRFKTQFVADAVHDLATPISGLSTRLYLLKRSPEKLQDHLNSLENQVSHLKDLLDDLKTLSQLDRNYLHLDRQPCQLNQLVTHVFDTYEPVAIEKKQSLQLKLESDLPNLELDQRQFERVVGNLISNAINYTPENKTITIQTTCTDNSIILSVRDEGMGISETDLTQIFERFYRSDEARSMLSSGTGLGLAITKSIVELHGGTIEAESELDKGTVITVTMPL